jgi:hypothetical protein
LRQGWKTFTWCALLASIVVAAAPVPSIAQKASDSETSAETAKPVKKRSLHQFTGFVTSIDEDGFTVEKRTKKTTRTKVFVRDDEMRVRGTLEEGAKVTVYYRADGDDVVAHRVVVKLPPPDESEE